MRRIARFFTKPTTFFRSTLVVRRSLRQLRPVIRTRRVQFVSGAIAGGLTIALCSTTDDKIRDLLRTGRSGDAEKTKRIIREGIDVNSIHELGWSTLHVAVINNQIEVVKALLDAGADVDIEDAFSSVVRMARTKEIPYELVFRRREGEFSDRLHPEANFLGFTPLHYAVLLGNVEMIKLLLNAGANPKKRDSQGRSSLYFAQDNPLLTSLLESAADQYESMKKKRELEERKRFPLEARIRQRLVGQEGAITTVGATVRRKENGWQDEDRPLVFLFLGSSGIGKTELAKQLAKYIHKESRKGFIRLDMSEYQQKHEVAKLIGSPPGYVGHDQGGQLTKQLKECPNAVVLFDEVEKAHPDVLTVMLQLFDEGRLTDGQGKTIECKDAIFVMTSNLASGEIASHAVQLRKDAEKAFKELRQQNPVQRDFGESVSLSRTFRDTVVQPILKRHFLRNEFLGRINEIVYFLPFSKSELRELVNKELQWWAKRAHDKHSVSLSWDSAVVDVLSEGYNIHYGARSIKHEVERRVINQLALAHENSLIQAGSELVIHVEDSVETVSGNDRLIRIRVTRPGQKPVEITQKK
ncbi:mitochondrial disaggregase-like [Oscarella lobularis]|uniref:mitochondrial disaggregase-like n=1 Tax=Oscarella lobularis TaxID=121494 RepID=UPI003313735E